MGKNPDAVLRAVQYFMYSIKKNPTNMPFKVIPTDEVIQKESNEIENMGKSRIVYYMMLNAKIFACFPICKSLLYAVCALPFFNQNKDQIIKLLQQQLCLQVLRSISV
jgi:hypothetical protein